MNKEFIKNATIKLAQSRGTDYNDLFNKEDKTAYNTALNIEKDLTFNRELGKLEATKKMGFGKSPLWLSALATGGVIVGISAIADKMIEFLRERATAAKSRSYYEKMLEAHPNLQKEDPKVLAKYWESLYHFAPHMAADPLASGAYITQSINRLSNEQLGGPPPDTFSTLTDIQKKFNEGRPKKDDLGNSARKDAVAQIIRQMYAN